MLKRKLSSDLLISLLLLEFSFQDVRNIFSVPPMCIFVS